MIILNEKQFLRFPN